MRHLTDVVIDSKTGGVIGNTQLRALCGASGSKLLPKGTAASTPDVCPRCLALAGKS